jgi:YggT family protein
MLWMPMRCVIRTAGLAAAGRRQEMLPLIALVSLVVQVLIILIIIQAILSWVPDLRWRFRGASRFLDTVTEPIMAPFRRLIPPSKTGGLDLSPILAIVALQIVERLLIFVLRR